MHVLASAFNDLQEVYSNYVNRDRRGKVDMDKREMITPEVLVHNEYHISDELKARAVRV